MTRVLLITSRETGRWVVPKGNPMKGFAPHEAAAQEAFEEAGLSGIADPSPIGDFRYVKRRGARRDRELSVTVFPLAVTAQAEDWPERLQRKTRWFLPTDASAAVEEPGLKRLIAGFGASRASD
ncbi:NUDIX hydrolase [Sphingomonas bacterium]|uniref:NUDIX hydrolase n=1 Tax=Sphingomonas bacterium TaxID=1895847 RepID=UPI0020C7155D|nr:NUDIX domain-containing protein [Sphingomonas bacterium]